MTPALAKIALLRRKRFFVAGLIVVAAVGALIYIGVRGSSMYYMTLAELKSKADTVYGDRIRLGATVVDGSIQSGDDAITRFVVTDGTNTLPVSYAGSLPNTFGDGADVVLQGKLTPSGTFEAASLLAKCPSKYKSSD